LPHHSTAALSNSPHPLPHTVGAIRPTVRNLIMIFFVDMKKNAVYRMETPKNGCTGKNVPKETMFLDD
jgi:hypothetical protein